MINNIEKLINETYIKRFEEYGKSIQLLNFELKDLIPSLEKLINNSSNSTNNNQTQILNINNPCNKEISDKTNIEGLSNLIDFINNLLQLEKINFENLVKLFQLKIKLNSLSNMIDRANDRDTKLNLINNKEEVENMIVKMKENLSYNRLNTSDFITESKYDLISKLE